MFCPQCGAENGLEQKYCRRCGLQLAAARMSLQGDVGATLMTYKKGQVLFSSGGVTLVIFILAALINIFLDSGPYPVLINLLVGLAIAVPLMAAGLVQLRRAERALNPKDEQSQLAAGQADGAWAIPSSTYSTDRLLSSTRAPDSITEQTTLHLKSPK